MLVAGNADLGSGGDIGARGGYGRRARSRRVVALLGRDGVAELGWWRKEEEMNMEAWCNDSCEEGSQGEMNEGGGRDKRRWPRLLSHRVEEKMRAHGCRLWVVAARRRRRGVLVID